MKYTRQHKNPNTKNSVRYLAEMFDLCDTDRVVDIIKNNEINCKGINTDNLAKIVRAIFLEKQLSKHNRQRINEKYSLDGINGNTIEQIAHDFVKRVDDMYNAKQNATPEQQQQASNAFYSFMNQSDDLADEYKKALKDKNKQSDIKGSYKYKGRPLTPATPKPRNVNPKELTKELAEVAKKVFQDTSCQYIADVMGQSFIKDMYCDMVKSEINGSTVEGYHGLHAGTDETIARLNKDAQGTYHHKELSRRLSAILDEIIGQSEIRAQERGFNRPSRFSHFVKDCFLPVYRCNKPRKRPAFYIDASGSMDDSRGAFPCVTSAIAGFLRTQDRRISELRPKYFAFTGAPYAMSFDIKKMLPMAHGGTSLKFLSALDVRDNNVIITDAQFSATDLAMLRFWAQDHPKTHVNWICNNVHTKSQLENVLRGIGTHKVHYTWF